MTKIIFGYLCSIKFRIRTKNMTIEINNFLYLWKTVVWDLERVNEADGVEENLFWLTSQLSEKTSH